MNINSSISCVRKFHICAGHRVLNHESKCKHYHGHNYTIYAEAKCEELDSIGRVIDFSEIKRILGTWLEDNWDHGFICNIEDTEAIEIFSNAVSSVDQKLYVMPYNPTAENMAKYLVEEICPDLFEDGGIVITKITVHETDNCSAAYTKMTE